MFKNFPLKLVKQVRRQCSNTRIYSHFFFLIVKIWGAHLAHTTFCSPNHHSQFHKKLFLKFQEDWKVIQKEHYTSNLTLFRIANFVTQFKVFQINIKLLSWLIVNIKLVLRSEKVNNTVEAIVGKLNGSSDKIVLYWMTLI